MVHECMEGGADDDRCVGARGDFRGSREVCRFTCDAESCLMCGAQGVRADSWDQACLDVLNKYKYCYTACTLHGDGDQPLRFTPTRINYMGQRYETFLLLLPNTVQLFMKLYEINVYTIFILGTYILHIDNK